jgi:hypothetical protein
VRHITAIRGRTISVNANQTAPADPQPRLDNSSQARTRDRVRYATAGTTGLSAVLLGFLLQGQGTLQKDLLQLHEGFTTLQTTIERVQGDTARTQNADRLAHAGIDPRLAVDDQRHAVLSRDIEGIQRCQVDLGQRVTKVEAQAANPIGLRATDITSRLAQLINAIRQVSPNDPGAWTNDIPPKPTAAALGAIIGTPVTTSERDLAAKLAPLTSPGK